MNERTKLEMERGREVVARNMRMILVNTWERERKIHRLRLTTDTQLVCYDVGNELIKDTLKNHPTELFVAKVELALKFAPKPVAWQRCERGGLDQQWISYIRGRGRGRGK